MTAERQTARHTDRQMDILTKTAHRYEACDNFLQPRKWLGQNLTSAKSRISGLFSSDRLWPKTTRLWRHRGEGRRQNQSGVLFSYPRSTLVDSNLNHEGKRSPGTSIIASTKIASDPHGQLVSKITVRNFGVKTTLLTRWFIHRCKISGYVKVINHKITHEERPFTSQRATFTRLSQLSTSGFEPLVHPSSCASPMLHLGVRQQKRKDKQIIPLGNERIQIVKFSLLKQSPWVEKRAAKQVTSLLPDAHYFQWKITSAHSGSLLSARVAMLTSVGHLLSTEPAYWTTFSIGRLRKPY